MTVGEVAFRAPAAEAKLIEVLWPAATYTAEPNQALSGALTRAVYLQQDLLRQFIESDSDQDRFNAVGELLGVGRVTELQVQLERARVAWSKVTNQKANDLAGSTARLKALTQKQGELKSAAMIARARGVAFTGTQIAGESQSVRNLATDWASEDVTRFRHDGCFNPKKSCSVDSA